MALRELRDGVGDELVLMADLCLDEYTDHGHCGVLEPDGDGRQRRHARAATRRIALAQAEAGADIVAPSGMMDGQVGAIRTALDGDGHDQVAILAYAAKYASALYGPFRDAVDVTIAGGGDRRAYQQDPHNRREALPEVAQRYRRRRRHGHGQAGDDATSMSSRRARLGRRSAGRVSRQRRVRHGARRPPQPGWIDGPAVALEHLIAIKRAGADFILTYFAAEVAEPLGG